MTVYIPPSGARQVAPSDMDARAARRIGKHIRHQQRPEQIGDPMGKPNLAARLAAERPCGCRWDRCCAQHWQAMSRAEQVAWKAGQVHRDTTVNRGDADGGDDAA